MFSGAIFDIDGTILDTMGVWKEITLKFLKNKGIVPTDKEMDNYRDLSMEETMRYTKEQFNLSESVEELKAGFEKLSREKYINEVPAKPYVKEYMEKLKSEGVKIGVATSGYPELWQHALKRLGMLHLIDGFALTSETGVNKSHPDVYLLAAERIGVEPSRCMVFEDILSGIIGAKKGGMMATAIYDDLNKAQTEEFKKLADRYIVSWKELL